MSWRGRPPGWLWPVSIVLQVASAAALTSYTYFFADDWLFISQARVTPIGVSYLRLPLFEHFSPVSRLLDKLLIHNSTGSFAFAHGVQLMLYALVLLVFALLMRELLGNRWLALALTVWFGQSLFLMRLLNWWTATVNILPATIFGLLTILGYIRWRRLRSRRWLVVTLGAFLMSLLDYETAILLPAFLLGMRLLVLEQRISLRGWLRALQGERPLWLGLGGLVLLGLVNYYSSYYVSLPGAGVGVSVHFVQIALVSTFIPALLGIKNPQAALGHHPAVIAACGVVAAAGVAYLLLTRPRAWRCLAVFVPFATLTMLPVGVNRVPTFGLHVAKELYYQQSLQYTCLVLIALALQLPARPLRLPSAFPQRRAMIRGPALVVLVAVYGTLYLTSVRAMAHAAREPQRSRAFVRTFRASVGAVVRQTRRAPVLFDATVPADVLSFAPFNRYDLFFPAIDSRVRYDEVAEPMYVVADSGRLVALQFLQQGGASLARPVCQPRVRHGHPLRVPLDRPLTLARSNLGLPPALQVSLQLPTARAIGALVESPWGRLTGPLVLGDFTRGRSARYFPLPVSGTVRAIRLGVPPGGCVVSLTVGSFISVP